MRDLGVDGMIIARLQGLVMRCVADSGDREFATHVRLCFSNPTRVASGSKASLVLPYRGLLSQRRWMDPFGRRFSQGMEFEY